MSNKPTINYQCPKCGCETSYKIITRYFEYGECISCGDLTYLKDFNNLPTAPVVRCPYCNSTNTKKISAFSRGVSLAMFGVFAAGKATKEWHCNNCNSNF